MSEMFVAVGDALDRAMVPVVQLAPDALPDRPRPWYLPESPPPSKAGARAAMDALIAKGRRH